MREKDRSLMIFAESELHRPPQLRKFGRALELVASKVPGVTVYPVAIRYDMSLHERPEAFMAVGEAMELGPDLSLRTRLAVQKLLDRTIVQIGHEPDVFKTLAEGTLDVNERWDFRARFGKKSK